MCCLLLAQVLVSNSSTLLHHPEVTSLLSSKYLIVIFLKTFIILTRNLTGAGLPCVGPPIGWHQLWFWVLISPCFETLAFVPVCLHSNPKAWRLLLCISACFLGFYVQPAGLPCKGKIRNLCHSYWGTSIRFLVMHLAINFCLMFSVYRNQTRQQYTSGIVKFIIWVHRC